MTFANVCVNREQLTLLSQLLLAAFPGCTIHQSRDPMRAAPRLSGQKIDAVFADADTCSDWIHSLKKHLSNPSVYLLCRQDSSPLVESEDIRGIVTYPITPEKIQNALLKIPQKSREVY